MSGPGQTFEITPKLLLRAYSIGMFPMAESADDPTLFWVDPDERGIFPLDGLIITKSLAKIVRSDRYDVKVDTDFEAVIENCAGGGDGRPSTWINARIRKLYGDLFRQGHVHTVETWQDGKMVGGLYGVAIGGAFFGESMFSRETGASQVALHALVTRLDERGFTLLDTQWTTEHLSRFGAHEIAREDYLRRLERAIRLPCQFMES